MKTGLILVLMMLALSCTASPSNEDGTKDEDETQMETSEETDESQENDDSDESDATDENDTPLDGSGDTEKADTADEVPSDTDTTDGSDDGPDSGDTNDSEDGGDSEVTSTDDTEDIDTHTVDSGTVDDVDSDTGTAIDTEVDTHDDTSETDDSESEDDSETEDDSDSGMPQSFQIMFDYSYDDAGFFDDAQRRVLMEVAAEHWEMHIASDFFAVPAGTSLRARHPEKPDEAGMDFSVDYDIDDMLILVGQCVLDGAGGQLAMSSNSFSEGVTDYDLAWDLYYRYYENPYQPWVAVMCFDVESDWFFDETPESDDDIPADENDFLNTAMHEIGHLLGVGYSAAFSALVVDGEFTGSAAATAYGGPIPLDADEGHFSGDIVGLDGEELLMDKGSKRGKRKYPAELEFLVLEDIGYEIK